MCKLPTRLLADTGAMTAADIATLAQTHPHAGVQSATGPQDVLQTSKQGAIRTNRAAEPQCLREWRARMDSEKPAVYKRRSNTEHAHARLKNRGFERMALRGLAKVRITMLASCRDPQPYVGH